MGLKLHVNWSLSPTEVKLIRQAILQNQLVLNILILAQEGVIQCCLKLPGLSINILMVIQDSK